MSALRSVLAAAFLSCAAAYEILHLNEGDICRDGSPPLYCKLPKDCPGVEQAIKRAKFPKICSFKGRNNPIVCCEPYSTPAVPKPSGSGGNGKPTTAVAPPNESKAEKMCEKYSKYVWKKMPGVLYGSGNELKDFCGIPAKPLIVDGEPAAPREFPHMARIGYGKKSSIRWGCGGSLISERFILSAAHCTNPAPDLVAKWAHLGDLDVSTDTDDAQPVTIGISERIDHPDYKTEYLYHDIALYKLESDAPLGIYIRPICLNTRPFMKAKAIASGWGDLHYGGRGSAMLQKVELPTASTRLCNESYLSNIGPNQQLPQGIVADYIICAGGAGKKDTCQGDSGGPLQIPLSSPYCMYSIVGVTSFGKLCAMGYPGAYTNVANYVKWIEDIVWP